MMERVTEHGQKLKAIYLSTMCMAVLFIIAQALMKGAGAIGNEFVYNLPWLMHQKGAVLDAPLLQFSNLFFNPIISVLNRSLSSYQSIYYCFAFINISFFIFVALFAFSKERIKGVTFVLLFLIICGNLLWSGTNSSMQYSLLLLGHTLSCREYHKSFYLFFLIAFALYPVCALIIGFIHFVRLLQNKKFAQSLSLLVLAIVVAATWKTYFSPRLLDDFYSRYLGWETILKDPFFFSESLISLADTPSFRSLLLSILSDNNKVGTSLLSLTAQGTPRFIAMILCFLAAIISPRFLWKRFRHSLPLIYCCFFLYAVAFIFAFKFYYPSRYVSALLHLLWIYFANESLWILWDKLGRKIIFFLVAIEVTAIAFYHSHSYLGPMVKVDNYLSHLDLSDRTLNYSDLKDFLKSEKFKDKTILASPRLSEILFVDGIINRPYITYKFADKSSALKERTHKLWDIYLAKNIELLHSLCSKHFIDYIIYESQLLEAIKEKRETNRNLMEPYRSNINVESLPIIDFPLSFMTSIGAFKVYKCFER